jgi:hypothetical protein
MVNGATKGETERDTTCAEPLPTLKAGREVGWIFQNGEAVAIERHEHDSRCNDESS